MALLKFPILYEHGIEVTIRFPHIINKTAAGFNSVIPRVVQPLLSYDISRNIMFPVNKNAIINFFTNIEGSEDTFLFLDISDFTATHTFRNNNNDSFPIVDGYQRGGTQGVVALSPDGNLRLAKKYQIGTYYVLRPITNAENVTIYENGITPYSVQPTIEEDTGIVTGATINDTWEGQFWIPCRIEDDDLSIRRDSPNYIYSIPSQKIKEVKRFYSGFEHLIPLNLTEHFSLAYQVGGQTRKNTKTVTTELDNQFEIRKQQWQNIDQSYNGQINLGSTDLEYLITLYRVCLGSYSSFKLHQFDNEITSSIDVFFSDELAFQVIGENERYLAEANINLQSLDTSLDMHLKKTYCHGVIINRKDGEVFSWTDHDQTLLVDSNIFNPFYSVNLSNTSSYSVEEEPDNLDIVGVVTGDIAGQITEEDVLALLFDDAEVIVSLIDWVSKTTVCSLFHGYIGQQELFYEQTGVSRFKFTLMSRIKDLSKNNTFITTQLCRHKFGIQGYGNCDVNFTIESAPSGSAIVVRTTVTGIINNKAFTAGSGSDNWAGFAFGRILFETGKLQGQEFIIAGGAIVTLTLKRGFYVLPEIGDQFIAYRNCDKLAVTCKNVFDNIENYGGQPRIPGFDGRIASSPSE